MTPASPLPNRAEEARDLTRAVYSALLERDPDEGGAEVYSHLFEHGGQLVDVIKCVAASTEFRERFMRQCAGESARAVFQGILRRDPTPEELTGAPADVAEQLRMLATSEEHWQAQLERNAARLAHELADRIQADMRGGAIDAPDLRSRGAVDGMLRRISAVTQTDEYCAALFRRRAVPVVNEIYLALLNRAADPAGLAQYAPELAAPADIGSVVRKIADSEEHWRRRLQDHRAELADLIYRSLLQRPATLEDLARCESQSVGTLLEELAHSDELWHSQLRRRAPEVITRVASAVEQGSADHHAAWTELIEGIKSLTESDQHFARLVNRRSEALINAVYQPLLQRSVDRDGMATYGTGMRSPDDIGRMIERILASPEYQRKARSANHPPAATPSPAAVAFGHVEQLFQKLARRAPSPLEVSHCLAHGAQIGRAAPAVLREVAIGREPRERKVLLFGAYGNGNMGDAYQAIALQKHLIRSWGLDESQVFATSIFDTSDFPFPASQKLPAETILNTRFVNQFDCLVVGGGGLIAHPHAPLFDAKWVRKLHTPVLLLGIGAELPTVELHRELLERAWVVSGRDQTSIAALKQVRADVLMIRDPVLSAVDIEELSTSDACSRPPALPNEENRADVLWILKYPDSQKNADFLSAVADLIREQPRVRHTVVAIEPDRDQVLEQFLPGKIHYLRSLSDLAPSLESARVVVSMRYHGCIFAALAGKPSVGYSQSKIKHLYADKLIPGLYEPAFDQLEEIVCAPEQIKSRFGSLNTLRRDFCSQLKTVGSLALMEDWSATATQPKGHVRRFLTSI